MPQLAKKLKVPTTAIFDNIGKASSHKESEREEKPKKKLMKRWGEKLLKKWGFGQRFLVLSKI